MKLLRSDKSGLTFHLGRREQSLLLETIKLYPLVPAAHHRLSKSGSGAKHNENQQLLESALAGQRRENRRQVLAMVNEPERFRAVKSGFELTLTPPQAEWLLQVLNDVRVGSWLALGEPDESEPPEVTETNAHFLLALELSGLFQSLLLEALAASDFPPAGET